MYHFVVVVCFHSLVFLTIYLIPSHSLEYLISQNFWEGLRVEIESMANEIYGRWRASTMGAWHLLLPSFTIGAFYNFTTYYLHISAIYHLLRILLYMCEYNVLEWLWDIRNVITFQFYSDALELGEESSLSLSFLFLSPSLPFSLPPLSRFSLCRNPQFC